ncbi:MAG TPA: acylphosphatase [Candidatus Marinimicrobia bacterium]|nr:acylphosphatase [Candidatus Neomarinimicrobiota bacterium]
MYRIHVMVSGKVQRVWFRKQTQTKALELGLTGWVKNFFSNAVELTAEGDMDSLTELTGWLQDGPPLASVDKLSIEWSPSQNKFTTFEIVR